MSARTLFRLLVVCLILAPTGWPGEVRATEPGLPGPPGSVVAVMGDGEATVTWAAPASYGDSPITGYTVTVVEDPSPAVTVTNLLLARVTGLTNGTPYRFSVAATNAMGTGPASAPSNVVTPTIATVVSNVQTWTGVRTFGNLTVLSGGSIRNAAGDTTLQIEVTGTLRIDSGGSLDVSGKGCATNARWGGAGCVSSSNTEGSGGSYGGLGGGSSPATYGDPTNPAELGSGGRYKYYNQNGGAGGGLVRLSAGSLILDGAIRANGQGSAGGAGSGGGVNVSVSSLAGSGLVEARGGASSSNGGGGGGRIAILADSSTFTGTLSAKAGSGSSNGGPGTLFSSDRSGAHPSLVVDGEGLSGPATPLPALPTDSTVRVRRNATIQLGGLRQYQDLTLETTAGLVHAAGDASLQVQVTGTLRIEAGATINVSERGCPADRRWNVGTSTCVTSSASEGAGGSYGGIGGRGGLAAYGSLANPAELGSGGRYKYYNQYGGAGGGLLRLSAGSLILDGAIRANGQGGAGGAGSGGGVNLSAISLAGSGLVEARGGTSSSWGGGGGGRIAIFAQTSTFTGTLSAPGGSGSAGGGAGTVSTRLAEVPIDVRVSNLTDSAFDLSWVSDRDASARVRYGYTDTLGARQVVGTARDVRGATHSGRTHYVSVGGVNPSTGASDPYWNLSPGTAYWFEILSDGAGEPVIFAGSATTGPSLAPGEADARFGYVATVNGTRVPNALVYLELRDADAAGSPGGARLLSAVTGADGSWYVDLSRARTADLASYFNYGPGDRLTYTANPTPTTRLSSRVVAVGWASPLTLTVPGADLALASANLEPAQPLAGVPTTWPVVVSNLGGRDWVGGSEGGSFAVQPLIDDQPQTLVSSTAALARGDSVTLSVPLVFTPGLQTLRFDLVPAGSQAPEDDPANNTLARAVTPLVADLAVASATLTPDLPVPGEWVTASVVISNQGTGDWLGSDTDSFFDLRLWLGGQVASSVRSDGPLGRGLSVTVGVPFTLSTGSRVARLEVVPAGRQVVGDVAANNMVTRSLSTAQADLAMAAASFTPTLPITGEVVTWTVVVDNRGHADWLGLGGDSYFDFLVSVDGQPRAIIRTEGPVAQGSGVTFTVPLTLTAGVRTVRFEVLPVGDEAVGDEVANNLLATTLTVHAPLTYRYQFGPGWNMVSLSLAPMVPARLSDLAAATNADGTNRLLEAYRFRSGVWAGALISGTGVAGDFELALGEGYLLRFVEQSTWELRGSEPVSPVPLALQATWNLIAVPYSSSPLTAGGVVAGTDIVSGTQVVHRITEIDRWVGGGYQGHVAGYPFNHFPIQRGWSYFVKAREPFIWVP